AMARVEGVEWFQFGPADFSASAGYRGQWEGPGVAEQILALKDTLVAAGKRCGVVATGPENLAERVRQGVRFIGLGIDAGLLVRLAAGEAGGGRPRPAADAVRLRRRGGRRCLTRTRRASASPGRATSSRPTARSATRTSGCRCSPPPRTSRC